MRILFVAYPCSVHTARWINQLPLDEWDVHLFPVHEGRVHPDLHDITVHSLFRSWPPEENSRVKRKGVRWPIATGRAGIKRYLGAFLPRVSDASRLARVIQSLQPDVIHVLEMQSAGYLMLETFQALNGSSRAPCIYSSWGSDLYLYARQDAHNARIRAFLAQCDYYIADCERDQNLAKELGFQGKSLGVFPGAGGYDLNLMRTFKLPGLPSSRRVIALKGYQGIRGANARAAINALRESLDMLSGYELVVYSVDEAIRPDLDELSSAGLTVNELPPSSHDEMLKLFGRARVAIGIGSSDGTPNAMLEAMAMGAFPIQSDTVSTGEWIDDGRNGFLVSPDASSIRNALYRAITEDSLVDESAGINSKLIERIDKRFVQPKVIGLYERVARGLPPGKNTVE